MLILNQINYQSSCKNYLSKNKIYAQKQVVAINSNQMHGYNVSFQGGLDTFRATINKKYLEFTMAKILKKFDSISSQLYSDKKSNLDDILNNDKLDELLKTAKEKTRTLFLPDEPLENGFSQVKSVIRDLGLPDNSEELKKRFDLFTTRKLIKNNTTEVLSYFKALDLFPPMKNAITHSIASMDTKIRCFGLSKDVRDIVIKSQKEFGVKLDIPDSKELADNIYKELSKQKHAGNALPEEICFTDFDFFIKNNPEQSASYVSGAKPANFQELVAKYPALSESQGKKKIYLNPIFLLSRQEKGDYPLIIEDLKHELGHFGHNIKIGDIAFNSKEMGSIDGFISKDDRNFLSDLKNNLSDNVCFIDDLNVEPEVNDYICRIIPDVKNIINNSDNPLNGSILDSKTIARFNQIIEKLERITQITLKQFPDCEDEACYALTSPKELIAFSIQKSHNRKYDKIFIDMLDALGLPNNNNY